MNKTEIVTNMTRAFHKVGFQIKKHSPEILVAAGVVGTVTSAVMACKATTKLNDVLEDSKTDIDRIHEATETGKVVNPETGVVLCDDYTVEDGKKDLTITYVQTGIKVARLYAPAVALGVISIAAIIKSNDILRKRNAALAAAYAVVDKSFKEYRGRVVERFGKELDRELRYNIKAAEVEETVVDEKGKEKKVKKTIDVIDDGLLGYSEYAKVFDDGCTGWTKDPEYNKSFLLLQQEQANKRLQLEGYLFLNDVYDMLGIPKTKAGQVVGWLYDEKNPNGDNYVDFGIFETHREKNRDFINGYERTIILDFNVDGYILDKI